MMSDDLIKREDAINTVKMHHFYALNADERAQAILDIPSADRPQGEWIKDEDGTYRCSNCGGCEEQYIYGTENWYGCGESKFCPNCGAKMKGADDEAD